LRARLTRESLNGDALRSAQQALTRISGVSEVRTNHEARSVLIAYDPTSLDLADLLKAMAAAGVTVVSTPDSKNERRDDQGGGALADSITGLFSDVDRRVADLTGGKADLRTLVPVSLAALAVREIVAGRVTAAPWYVFLWYAFDSFMKLGRARTSSNDQT
jgi:cation transport ATPase